MQQTVADLREARRLISAPERWTRYAWARDGHGRQCNSLSPTAVQWCARGAVMRACGGHAGRMLRVHEVFDRLSPVRNQNGTPVGLLALNDCFFGGHSTVLDVLEHIANALEAELIGAQIVRTKRGAHVEARCAV